MILLKKIKVCVFTSDKKKYGFSFEFKEGLNIISGENSSGKSGVLSSIYYCLGMEQLLGGVSNDIFKDSVAKEFKYNNKLHKVFNSYAELEIQNIQKDKAILKREIISQFQINLNHIRVRVNGEKTETKYVHSRGDTDNKEGFYKWLSGFLGIEIPIYKEADEKAQKILYLQHLFAPSLIEQTKGWSDFFALLPNFIGIKKPKQKIIAYTLGLNSITNDFRKDILQEEEKKEKESWANEIRNFNSLASYLNLYSPSLLEKYNAKYTPTKINRLSLQTKDNEGNTISIKEVIEQKKNELKVIKQKNKIIPSLQEKINTNLARQTKLKETIKVLNIELQKIKKEQINEVLKRQNYQERIKAITQEINVLESLKKIDELEELSIKQVKNCPVCNSKLTNDQELKNLEKINSSESILFYKSELSLYKLYLKNSDELMGRFDKIILYYEDRINEQSILLDSINKQLTEDSRIPSRIDIAKEVHIEYELRRLENIQNSYELLKNRLVEISEKLAKIRYDKKELQEHEKEDEDIINMFLKRFKNLLVRFSYPNEVASRVIIKKDPPSNLLPIVFEGRGINFPIRSKASASDFIRALWSFYLSLIEGKNHIGLLILDEPGQHAMKLKDMKTLIKVTSKMRSKQVILAISNDKERNEYALSDLLEGVKEDIDYHIQMINDNNREDKCVQLL